jgi:hypothetical protein
MAIMEFDSILPHSKSSWWRFASCFQLLKFAKLLFRLFNPVLPKSMLQNEDYAERVKKIYATLSEIDTDRPPRIERLTISTVRKFQSLALSWSFQELFDLRLDPSDANALAFNPHASVVCKDFIDFCQRRSLGVRLNRSYLKKQLHNYVNEKGDYERRLIIRQRILFLYQRQAEALGRIVSWWPRTKAKILQIYWAKADEMRERQYDRVAIHASKELAGQLRCSHDIFRRHMQESVTGMLGYHTDFKAIGIVLETAGRLHSVDGRFDEKWLKVLRRFNKNLDKFRHSIKN